MRCWAGCGACCAGGMLFCRLASDIGMETRVQPLADAATACRTAGALPRRRGDAAGITRSLGGGLLDPLKTTVVQDQRCMTTWVVRKSL